MNLLRQLRPTFSLRSTILAVVTVVIVSFATLLGLFEYLELKAIDAAFNIRGPLAPVAPIIIVAIDDESFRESGQPEWPWSRAYQADLVNGIAAGNPKSITIDIFWSEPGSDEGGDAKLAQAIAEAGNVILANDINHVTGAGFEYDELRNPLPEIRAGAIHVGIANLLRDSDGSVRSMPFYLTHTADQQAYFSWAAYTLFSNLDVPPPTSISSSGVQIGERTIPLDNGMLRINYLGSPGQVFEQVQAYQVVTGEIFLSDHKGPDYFKDKIILVGATAESLHDTYPTPFRGDIQPMPGVEINAHLIDTILSQRYISRWNILTAVFVTFVLGLFAYLLSTIPQSFVSLTLALGTTLFYLLFWIVSFNQLRTEVYVIAPLAGLLLGFAVPSVEHAFSEQAEKRRVRGIFERFVSPEMVDQMIGRGLEATRGQRTELTVLFSDIRGFTTLAESLSPDQVVDLLNEYLGVMTDVILKHGGTIDKYEGDLIMAFFNAPLPQPDHARRAVAAAIDMRFTLDTLKAKWAKDKSRPANFEMGIGLNTGEAFVGLLGSEKRINYTCIGDTVNLASRVQDLTKEMHWPLLITEFTYEVVKNEFDCEFAEARLVKGKTKPVGMYRVLGRKGAPPAERIRALFT